ncbi:CCR4-NOT transcription complex subunit 4-like isoform X5 [Seriola dumerili]|uniref:CCR4-NOT transcription complex subunit 4-like isoform X5 n=1 Tax=Seriola dumerili TaxID=41447 RepID=UPI000BBECDA5|nr:CCR4-NOT transcription complex subunit 4-like isoform X5 [Seriola dumerili]
MLRSPEVKDDPMECPLCMEPLEIDDVNFFPCTCGYQICRFCWHRIRTDENGLCPACRKPYPEDPAVYKPLSHEELQRIKNEKKQKQNEKKQKITENRKHLASVRVVQRNLVFVVGLSQRLADPEVLKRPEYFGKFGKIHKVVINNSTSYAGSQGPSASAYVTYIRSEDALRAIQCVNNVVVDGRTLKASLGTTKYCSYFLKSMQCPKPDCMYLHELGDEAASFTKEEMQAGKHQEYEQKLQDLYKINPTFLQTSAVSGDKPKGKANSLHIPSDKLPEMISIGNGETSQLLPGGDFPSPPPGLSKPSLVVPVSVTGHTAHSLFEVAAAESQSLFSDNSNFRHPNPLPSGLCSFPSSPHSNSDWPTAPEPQSLFTSDTIPVSSSTDWQAAFGFGSSKQQQQEDDLGFDPFDVTRRGLADLIEKELCVEDSFSSSLTPPSFLPHRNHKHLLNKGLGPPGGPPPSHHLPHSHHFSQNQHPHRGGYGFPTHLNSSSSSSSSPSSSSCSSTVFSSPSSSAFRQSWTGSTSSRSNFVHLNHTVSPTASNSSFLDFTLLPGHHSSGLGGIPITGISASSSNSLDSLQDDNPPHWLKSLQTLTEMDAPSSSASQKGPLGSQRPPYRAVWAHYPTPTSQFHSPPPGFQTAFRPPTQTQTDLRQSAAIDRH